MLKNVASKLIVFCWDVSTGLPKTGDSANLTAYRSLDFGSVTVLADTSATEMDSSNAKGYYLFDLAQGETNGDVILYSCKSSTSNITCVAVPAVVFTVPTTGLLAPTVAGRTLDVSSGGEAGLDWANVGSPTTSLALTGTTVATTQKVDVETIKTQTVTCAAGVTVLASVGTAATSTAQTGDSFARLTGTGAITFASLAVSGTTTFTGAVTASNASNNIVGIDVAKISGDATAADNAESFFDGTGYAGTGNTIPTVTDVTNLHASAATAANQTTILARLGAFTGSGVNTILGFFKALLKSDASTPSDVGGTFDPSTDSTQAIRDNMGTAQTGDAYAVVSSGTFGNAAIKTETAAIKAKTDNLPAAPAAVGSAMILTSAYDFAKGTVAMTESYAVDGAAPTPAQALFLIQQALTEFTITSTTTTVKKLDGSTTAATLTLNDATNPTGVTRAT